MHMPTAHVATVTNLNLNQPQPKRKTKQMLQRNHSYKKQHLPRACRMHHAPYLLEEPDEEVVSKR